MPGFLTMVLYWGMAASIYWVLKDIWPQGNWPFMILCSVFWPATAALVLVATLAYQAGRGAAHVLDRKARRRERVEAEWEDFKNSEAYLLLMSEEVQE